MLWSTLGEPPERDERLADRCYRGTPIAAIAAEVGITDAGVLYHFPTKAELFWAMVDVHIDQQAWRFGELIQPGGLEAIRNLAAWGEIMEERPDLLGLQVVLSAEGIAEESDAHDYWVTRYRDVQAVIAALFRQGIDSGDIRDDVNIDA